MRLSFADFLFFRTVALLLDPPISAPGTETSTGARQLRLERHIRPWLVNLRLGAEAGGAGHGVDDRFYSFKSPNDLGGGSIALASRVKGFLR